MKHKVDRQEIPDNMILLIGFATTVSIVGIVLLTFSAVYESVLTEIIASVMVASAILAIFGVNIYAWKRSKPDSLTFDKLVKRDIDEFFENVNSYYAKNAE